MSFQERLLVLHAGNALQLFWTNINHGTAVTGIAAGTFGSGSTMGIAPMQTYLIW